MFTLPDLQYQYEALEPYVDAETMQIHHDKHHATYVENLNKALEGHTDWLNMDVKEILGRLNEVPEEIRTKVRNNAGGHANHSFFWKIMAPSTNFQLPEGNLKEAIDLSFGSLEVLQDKFTATALGRFGSGWAWVVVDNGKLIITDTPNQDTPLMEGKKAILGLDVWEHAYYLKFKNMRAEYVKAWWNVINWPKVGENFAKATS